MNSSLSGLGKAFSCTKQCFGDRSKNPFICLRQLSSNKLQCSNVPSSVSSNAFSSVGDSAPVSSSSWFHSLFFVYIPLLLFIILCVTLFSAYIKTLVSLFMVNLTVNNSNGEEFDTSKEILEREVDDVVILSVENKYSLAEKTRRRKTPFGFCMVNREMDIVTNIASKLERMREFMAHYDDISEQIRGLFHEVEDATDGNTETEVVPCSESNSNPTQAK